MTRSAGSSAELMRRASDLDHELFTLVRPQTVEVSIPGRNCPVHDDRCFNELRCVLGIVERIRDLCDRLFFNRFRERANREEENIGESALGLNAVWERS